MIWSWEGSKSQRRGEVCGLRGTAQDVLMVGVRMEMKDLVVLMKEGRKER